MNVDALGGNANLAGVLEGAHGDFWSGLLDVDVGKDDGGVVTTELEGYALERAGAGGHDLLARGDGAGEGDFGNVRVLGEHGAELVVAADGLDDTGRENLLSELNGFQGSVRGEGARLHDDGIAGQEGRDDLPHGEDNGEVPGANRTDDTKWRVSGCHDLLIVLIALLRDGQGQMVAEKASNTLGLNLGKLALIFR